MPFHLAILTTHPIQYYAPVFKLLAAEKDIELKVFYTLGDDREIKDEGFGKAITWDIPLLDGYEFEFLENRSNHPTSSQFNGIDNPSLFERVDQFRPNAILVYGWAYKSHLKALKHYHNTIPIWFRGDSTLLNPSPLWKRIIRKISLTWIYKKIDLAFYVGTNNQEYFISNGMSQHQLIFAPHAIDNNRFRIECNDEKQLLRHQFKIADDHILILYAGKLEPVKNLNLLLDAFIRINIPNAHLLFVGNGVLEGKLIAESKKHKTADRIHFIDFQNQRNMPVVYQACDIFCLPSLSETWGLSVNEAMAAGKAILVSDQVGCAIDLVKNNENGFIFESNDLTSLAKHLRTMIESGKLKEMGEISKAKILSWSFSDQVKAIMSQINKHVI
ncbi:MULTISPECIES: glycosyltransferase family 4 protein [unclassified Pedobacter]|uniref:glycosyltransferase family 4 protein n=1 Tax=unclassified Pedobacter TaxID=2628915 RepID=UPI001D690FF2|nr:MULTISPECIES: glycosyltransferase family 4 protein [unclassified Pedobacter]CAH0166956.1 N-acetylgalactosamine-N, N'-diacetylbacillosaminyl-diphospho-undecaprenol 4-alpha-N-acetylgalactosaminyltransferase [Pedobacter sp. Bi126]CAH0285373.1 N-acetylgalactosamine-N, N'-diacetylbacillosaminyl-diphospho-undecaprenol 4-alpha-N-acetylgalactosaminyltransferase [Pedobacter sp. Bi36]